MWIHAGPHPKYRSCLNETEIDENTKQVPSNNLPDPSLLLSSTTVSTAGLLSDECILAAGTPVLGGWEDDLSVRKAVVRPASPVSPSSMLHIDIMSTSFLVKL
jgi:hypothetical protein